MLGSTVGTNNQSTTGLTTGNTAQNTMTAGQTSSTAHPAIEAAALGNLDYVNKLRDQGFDPYTGQQVAGFSPQQQASFGLTDSIVGNGTGDQSKALIGQYAGAGPQTVSADTIQSGMSPYMNQYVMDALKPQLAQMQINNAKEMAAVNANATGSGAFGDARAGIEASNTRFNQNQTREGVIGQAYDRAFNTAIGASAQDAGNKLTADTTNAAYGETALNRALGGSTALQQLQNQQLGVANAQNVAGGQQTAQQQAELTAKYNQWLMEQQYKMQTAQLANQTVGQASSALPATTNTVNAGSTTGSNTHATQGNTTGTTTQNTQQNTTGTSNTDTTANTAATGTNQSFGTQQGTTTEGKADNSGWALGGTLLSAFI